MEINEIIKTHDKGYNCSQIVFSALSEKVGIPKETAFMTAASFGGGMYRAETCGCITGALMAIGAKNGMLNPNELERKVDNGRKVNDFQRRFIEKYKCLCCRDLLGLDITTAEGKLEMAEKKLSNNFCAHAMKFSIELAEEYL